MYIEKFQLKSFRCFKDEQELTFAIPDNEKEGSGITYIVGENNSGKTSLLEGLKYSKTYNIQSSALRSSDIRSDDVYFRTIGKDLGIVKDLHLMRSGSFSLKDNAENMDDRTRNKLPLVFVPSRRQWNPQVLNQQDIESAKTNLF